MYIQYLLMLAEVNGWHITSLNTTEAKLNEDAFTVPFNDALWAVDGKSMFAFISHCLINSKVT